MKNYRYSLKGLTLLLTLVAFLSCRKDKNQDTNLILSEIIDEFEIGLLEKLSPNGKQLVLQVKTLEEVDCENASLDYSLEQSSGEIIISINEINLPSYAECVKNPTFLTTHIQLGVLPDGPTDIEVNLRQTVQNQGKLDNDDTHYRLNLRTKHGIDLPHQKLYKINQRTIWGYIGYRTQDSPIVDNFFNDLTRHTEEGNYEEGNYGHFVYDKSTEEIVLFEDNHELPYVRRFLLRLTSNTSELKALLDQYRQQYGAEIELEIRTWEGEAY